MLLSSQPFENGAGHRRPAAPADRQIATLGLRNSLAYALMATAREPLLILDGKLRVLAASRPYYRMFPMKLLASQDSLFCEPRSLSWNIPALQLLQHALSNNAVVEGEEIELDVPGVGRRTMLLNARPTTVDASTESAMLVALEDVTVPREAARLKAALDRHQQMLLLEVNHRVANSLQIIASILLMKARTVRSEESRGHLRDMHQRLILVASIQRRLCGSEAADEIAFGPYLAQLCTDLANAMVEGDAVTIRSSSSDGTVKSDDAMNFGLIVTELVINALKHGFPDGRKGRINVDFSADGPHWRLSVSDDGIGKLPGAAGPGHAGLGTNIVEALARHLKATVQNIATGTGTMTAVVHTA